MKMGIEKIGHYSITNQHSVYDEEAMTALELAGRTAKKVNEVIDYLDEATAKVDSIPKDVETTIDKHIRSGDFDRAIDQYAGALEDRLDNLLENTPEGSTTMDAEVVDARVGADGKNHRYLGTAIREQYLDVKDSDNDKLSARAQEYGYRKNLNRRSLWVQGWLSSETGEHGTSGTDGNMYIATSFIPESVERVISNGRPMEIHVFTNQGVFLHRLTGRFNDYTFDHSINRYKIHVTGYVNNILDYDVKKMSISVENGDYNEILMLADPITETPDTVSASAEKVGYKRDMNRRSLWSQGYLYGATGVEGVDPAGYDYWLYSRSGFLPADVEKIAVDGGYKARLFKYDIKKNFVGYVDVVGVSDYLDESYYYRVDVRPTTAELGDRCLVNDVWDKVKLLSVRDVTTGSSATGVNSPFKSDAVFKPYTHKHITIDTDDACVGISAELNGGDYASFSYIGGLVLDHDSGGNEITFERFKPAIVDKTTPKILIVGGQHGFEKGSVLGLLKLIQYLEEIEIPSILRQVELLVIPCLCPVAFDRNTYQNANDVNLNRNYGYAWKPYPKDDDADNYGEAPFDQPETRALRDLILKERPDIVIDFHSLGSGCIDRVEDTNVFYACGFTDPYYMKLKNAIIAHLNDLTYSLDGCETYYADKNTAGRYSGFDGTINNKASLDNWCAYELNTLSLTVEGNNGIGSGTVGLLTPAVVAQNCEIILNFLCQVLAEYSRG